MKAKKILFIDTSLVRDQMISLEHLTTKTNELWDLLWDFGISDPEAIKDPIKAVNEKLHESTVIKSEFEIAAEKIAELINKTEPYKRLKELAGEVTNHKLFDKIRWNKERFSISSHAKKQLEEEATQYLTGTKEINLAERLEKFIQEYNWICDTFGFSPLIRKRLLNALPLFRFDVVNGKVVINPRRFKDHLKNIKI